MKFRLRFLFSFTPSINNNIFSIVQESKNTCFSTRFISDLKFSDFFLTHWYSLIQLFV